MTRYAALLRGINLGPVNRVSMGELRGALTAAGHRNVRTHLQSGNVVLDSVDDAPAVRASIVDVVRSVAGTEIPCLVLDPAEFRAVADANPLTGLITDGARFVVHFLSAVPAADRLAAADLVALDPERIAVGPRAVYQWCPDGFRKAPAAGSFAEKHLGVTVTTRNWNTVVALRKLLET